MGLPDFLIIGTQRGGTTTLYDLMCRHTLIAPAVRKEVHFFNRDFHLKEAHYRTFFKADAEQITGEATPYYLFHPEVPARVASLLSEVRLIAILRDPAERALSQYHLNRRRDQEPLDSFEAAIDAEEERLTSLASLSRDPYANRLYSTASYLARGRYAEQLERWLDHFERSRLLILKSEDLYRDPADTLLRVHNYLDLSPEASVARGELHRPELVSGHLGVYEPMSENTRLRLNTYFAPHNAHLLDLVGVDF